MILCILGFFLFSFFCLFIAFFVFTFSYDRSLKGASFLSL